MNREGRRFVDETAAYAVMSGVVGSQTGGSCFAIFDEETRARAEPDPAFRDAFAAEIRPAILFGRIAGGNAAAHAAGSA